MSIFLANAMTNGPEQELVQELVQELEQLFREHYPMLYRTAYSMLDNPADAEDVPQTIFLRLLRSGLPPDLKRNPQGYLYRAAVNLSLNVIRARKRRRLSDNNPEDLEIAIESSQSTATADLQQSLAEAIAHLEPEVAHVVLLRYAHNYSDAEIAKLLGVSRGTVAMRLFRARARIKKLMRNKLGDKS
jgi:RNA polymerase sigma-70 factor (ECF subfamily)